MWFSQTCSPFTFSEDRLSLVCTEGDSRVSSQNRSFRGRHPQLILERNLFPVPRKRENTKVVFFWGGLSETKSVKIKRSLVVSAGHTEKVLPLQVRTKWETSSEGKSLMQSPPGGQGKKQKKQLASLILGVIYLKGHLFHNISFFPNAYS